MSKDRTKYCSDLAKLFKAIKADDRDTVLRLVLRERSLINRLYDPTFDKKSCTPLAYAYKHNKMGICILLVGLDANVNVQTGYKSSVQRGTHIDHLTDQAYSMDEEPLALRALNKGELEYLKVFASSSNFSLFPDHTKPMTGEHGILARLTKATFPLENFSDDIAAALRKHVEKQKEKAQVILANAELYERLATAFASVNKEKSKDADKGANNNIAPKPKKFNR